MKYQKKILVIIFALFSTFASNAAAMIDHTWLLEFGEDRIMDLSADCSNIPDLEVGILGTGIFGLKVTSDLCHNVNTLTEAGYQCKLFLDYPTFTFCSKDEREVQFMQMVENEGNYPENISHIKPLSITFDCESLDLCDLEPEEIRTQLSNPNTSITQISEIDFEDEYFRFTGKTRSLEGVEVSGVEGANYWELSINNIYASKLIENLNDPEADLDLNLICGLIRGGDYHEGSATEILGVRVDSDICSNISSMKDRGFNCSTKMTMGLQGISVSFQGVKCQNAAAIVSIEPNLTRFTNTTIEERYLKDYVGQDLSRWYPNQDIVADHWNSNIEEYLSLEAKYVSFNCDAINACSNTGEQVARYIVDNLNTISELEKNYSSNIYTGITHLGETLTIAPADGFFMRLFLERSQLDHNNNDGISIK